MENPTLVVSSAEAVTEIMKTHDLAFSDRPQNIAAKILLYGCTNIAFSLYGQNWRHKRKISVLQLLNMKRVQSLHQIREEEVANLVNKLRDVSSSDDECYVNLSEMLMSTSSDVACKCALGRKYSGDGHSRVKELANDVMHQLVAFTVGDYFPLLGWVDFLTGKIQEYKATFHALDALFDQTIAENLTENMEGDHSENKSFVNVLLQLQQSNNLNFELTKNDVKTLLLDMFAGGTDTTAVTAEWAMSELMRNPAIMKKAQEEVRKIVGHKSKIEESDMSQMHYLKCIIKETLRLHPAAPLLAPRTTISSVKLRGYDIPAKTLVYVNAWAIHRDPNFWESPEEFTPERFENSQIDYKSQHFHYIPFGFGRRGCPGIYFGLALVEYFLANLLCWFDWKLPESDEHKDIDMSEKFGLVVSRKIPLYLNPVTFPSKF
ncbi:Cytochrome P450 [Vigna unguiculata]|uniref:Cytochrome P450 n=2 Tax=Vigna unguiculata TaxID=3917 RepID=A0A4D6KWM3_VIGUN|nr:Cytochrome P450 [Vigna unguiculata]